MPFEQMKSTKPTMQNKSVAGGPLALFQKDPPTGFFRDGYCRTTEEDKGNHSVAALLTDEFLDFSADKGNNLKEHGVKGGMKWCLCAHRWQEAYDAFKNGKLGKEAVPQVFLHASDESALKTVSYKQLKEFRHEAQAPSEGNRQPTHIDPDKASSEQPDVRYNMESAGRGAQPKHAH